MARGNVQACARREFGQRRLAARLGDGFQQIQSAVDRLNVVAFALSGRARIGPWSPVRQDCRIHDCFLPALREVAQTG